MINYVVNFTLSNHDTGYDVIAERIMRYYRTHNQDTVIVSLGISYDDKKWEYMNEVAYPIDYLCSEIEFLNDWWEGQKYIKLFGIKSVSNLKINGE